MQLESNWASTPSALAAQPLQAGIDWLRKTFFAPLIFCQISLKKIQNKKCEAQALLPILGLQHIVLIGHIAGGGVRGHEGL